MKRKNGFILLDELLGEKECQLLVDFYEDSEDVSEVVTQSKMRLLFSYQGEEYFFKPFIDEIDTPGFYSIYSELIVQELAKEFEIPCVEYDLAVYNGDHGVITKNFKKADSDYLSGSEVLGDYVVSILDFKHGTTDFYDNLYTYNSLEGIWNALEYRYRYHFNKAQIVKKLMDRLVDIFVFDILTGQADRHFDNWGIVEGKEEIDVQPLYDNELIISSDYLALKVSVPLDEDSESIIFQKIAATLDQFISVSGVEFLDKIKEKRKLINRETIEKVLSNVENKININIPVEQKEKLWDGFEKNNNIIDEVIEKYEENNRKR